MLGAEEPNALLRGLPAGMAPGGMAAGTFKRSSKTDNT
jgi:hypothetical protein